MADATGPGLADPRRGQLVEERAARLRALLEDRGAAGALLSSRRDFAWLTAGGANHVVLASEQGVAPILVTADVMRVLAPVNEAARLRDEELAGSGIEVAEVPWYDAAAAAREAERVARGSVLEDSALEAALVGERSHLSGLEHDRMRWLAAVVGDTTSQVLGAIEGWEREDDLAAQTLAAFAHDGVRLPVLLVAADERIERYRHPLPTAAPIRRRVMLVVVAERWGLHVASTRFRELEPPSAELRRRIAAAESVLAALHEQTRPGGTLGEALHAARAAYDAAGFPDEWTLHHQGGTIGYQGRERIAVPADTTTIEPGMAFAWNPSVTGAKVEETSIVGADGRLEILTRR